MSAVARLGGVPWGASRRGVRCRAALSAVLAGGLLFGSSREAAAAPAAPSEPVRVLVIGNSLVYANNMPAMLASMASSLGRPVVTRMVVEGGASLRDHWRNGEAIAALRSAPWDFVILADQSRFGQVLLLHGRYRVASADEFFEYGRLFAQEIAKVGARAVLLCHWKDVDAPDEDQAAIDHACGRLARELGAIAVPAGVAFGSILRSRPSIRLYDDDGHHPSAAGSYLLAAMFHAALLDRSPEGGAGRIEGRPIDLDSGSEAGEPALLIDLDGATARLLQRRAWTLTSELRADSAWFPPRMPTLDWPQLPSGRPIQVADLVGRWRGPTDLYPWMGELRLLVSTEGGGVSLTAAVSFGGRPSDVEISPREIRFDGTQLSWLDPNGPNGSTIRYLGVMVGAELHGIVQMTSPDESIYGAGEWRLTRSEK